MMDELWSGPKWPLLLPGALLPEYADYSSVSTNIIIILLLLFLYLLYVHFFPLLEFVESTVC
jgi:hypothetical protein